MSYQIAMALRRRPSPRSMVSQYGSPALERGARCGGARSATPASERLQSLATAKRLLTAGLL